MSTKMLIDARHEEETRVTIVRGSRVEEFDYENIARKQLKGSIYLARVTRVEPSLQAAFVEYGGNRHGFLAFSEIHPDYYQIPTEDREALREEMLATVERMSQEERAREAGEESDDDDDTQPNRRRGRGRPTRRSRSSNQSDDAQTEDDDETSADAPVDDLVPDEDETADETEVADLDDTSAENDVSDEPSPVDSNSTEEATDDPVLQVADDEPSIAQPTDTQPTDTQSADTDDNIDTENAPASVPASVEEDLNTEDNAAAVPEETAPEADSEGAEEQVNDDDEDDDDAPTPDVIAEDTGIEEDQPEAISEPLDTIETPAEETPAAETETVSEDGDTLPGVSGLITLAQPIVEENSESLEETVAEALAASANWAREQENSDSREGPADAVAANAEDGLAFDDDSAGEKRSRRRGPRRSRPSRGRKRADAEATPQGASEDAIEGEVLPPHEAAGTEPEDGEETEDKRPAMTDQEMIEAIVRRRMLKAMRRRYSIQEVIKKRQIILVQVAKEERGNKGAALTTYISLAGRYCVLMPNSTHSGGVSRKISSASDRRRLKSVIADLNMPTDMGMIIRTAGMTRTKAEIKRDYEYLLRLWNDIRSLTLSSVAPAVIYEEADLIRRSIRDMYTRDVEEILVEGERGYRAAKDFMKLLVPSHARRVQHYKDRIPLFHRYQVESQLESMYQPTVSLKSGGYVVINPTEALISIDVNSGRSTKEFNIEETALKTNIEAAEEIARQLRLRDMAGLVVIDFIDMEERSNIRTVEKRMKEAVKNDRARIQIGRISTFGLMEMSRQRLRPNLLEASTVECPHCKGTGLVLSLEAAALLVLRKLEEEGIRARSSNVDVRCEPDVASYLLNSKREALLNLEKSYGLSIAITGELGRGASDSELVRTAGSPSPVQALQTIDAMPDLEDPDETTESEEQPSASDETDTDGDDRPRRRRRRRRRGRRRDEDQTPEATESDSGDSDEDESDTDSSGEKSDDNGRDDGRDDGRGRRRRGRRGGRRRRNARDTEDAAETQEDDASNANDSGEPSSEVDLAAGDQEAVAQTDSDAPTAEASVSTDESAPEAGDDQPTAEQQGTSESVDTAETGSSEPASEVATSAPDAPKSDAPESETSEASADDTPVSVDVSEVQEAEEAPVKQPVSSAEIEVKMVSEAAENKPKKRGWWSRVRGE